MTVSALWSSLRTRFMVVMTLSVMALYLSTAWLVHTLAWRSGLQHLDERVEKRLSGFVADIDWQVGGMDLDFHLSSPPEFAERSRRAFYILRGPKQDIILRSYSLALEEDFTTQHDDEFETVELPDGTHARARSATFRPPIDEDADRTKLSYPQLDGPENVFHLTVAESTLDVEEHLSGVTNALRLGGIFLAATCMIISALAARWLHRPIVQLANSVRDIDADTLHKRLPDDDTPSEIRPIVAQFNALLDRLAAAVQRERRFATAVAHELRTPVTELRMITDVALLDAVPENPREALTNVNDIATRMTSLIDVLSALHWNHESRRVEPQCVDLHQLIEHVADTMRPAFATEGKQIIARLPAIATSVTTDPHLLTAILTNIVRNAQQHSPPKSLTEIAFSSRTIVVSNDVTSLDQEDLAMLTEPFWQKDSARTHHDRFGIGLTLCQTYAEMLGATLRFELNSGRFSAIVMLNEDTGPMEATA